MLHVEGLDKLEGQSDSATSEGSSEQEDVLPGWAVQTAADSHALACQRQHLNL